MHSDNTFFCLILQAVYLRIRSFIGAASKYLGKMRDSFNSRIYLAHISALVGEYVFILSEFIREDSNAFSARIKSDAERAKLNKVIFEPFSFTF